MGYKLQIGKIINDKNNIERNYGKMKMSDDARRAQREYLRDWRKKNPDKMRQYAASYWERKAERERAKNECKETE